MPNTTCTIEDCEKRAAARGWCAAHYERWRRHGDPLVVLIPSPRIAGLPLLHRIATYVDASGDCWQWTGSINTHGYGYLRLNQRHHAAHRWVWTELVGPIPEGLEMDHLCRNKSCVNPDHLEPVTTRENQLRGYGASGRNARKTHCPKGHPLTGANLRTRSRGDRECRTCIRVRRAKKRRER